MKIFTAGLWQTACWTVTCFQSAVRHSVTGNTGKLIFGRGTRLIVDSGEMKKSQIFIKTFLNQHWTNVDPVESVWLYEVLKVVKAFMRSSQQSELKHEPQTDIKKKEHTVCFFSKFFAEMNQKTILKSFTQF